MMRNVMHFLEQRKARRIGTVSRLDAERSGNGGLAFLPPYTFPAIPMRLGAGGSDFARNARRVFAGLSQGAPQSYAKKGGLHE